jgi:hypothetical protein
VGRGRDDVVGRLATGEGSRVHKEQQKSRGDTFLPELVMDPVSYQRVMDARSQSTAWRLRMGELGQFRNNFYPRWSLPGNQRRSTKNAGAGLLSTTRSVQGTSEACVLNRFEDDRSPLVVCGRWGRTMCSVWRVWIRLTHRYRFPFSPKRGEMRCEPRASQAPTQNDTSE